MQLNNKFLRTPMFIPFKRDHRRSGLRGLQGAPDSLVCRGGGGQVQLLLKPREEGWVCLGGCFQGYV